MLKQIFKKIIIYLLILESKLTLKKYKPKIVAITGNIGKTSAKDAIFTVLSSAYFVRKSEKSFNSEIGIPLTILGLPNGWSNIFIWIYNIFDGLKLIFLKNHYPKWLVLEIGADRPGDIEKNSDIVASNEKIIYENNKPKGISFRVDYKGNSIPVNINGALGKQHIYPALSAMAVGIS